jgi:hypothetical protein
VSSQPERMQISVDWLDNSTEGSFPMRKDDCHGGMFVYALTKVAAKLGEMVHSTMATLFLFPCATCVDDHILLDQIAQGPHMALRPVFAQHPALLAW